MDNSNNLSEIAKLVRYFILKMTTKAGSGHLTSSLSAVEIMCALFFGKLRYDLDNPKNPNNDRVIFSKGHASPLYYALYAAAGAIDETELEGYRTIDSVLEGHPNPSFKYADTATGSLGQGLGIGLGMVLAMRQEFQISNAKFPMPNVYVLLGDSEMAEGSVWEAIAAASYYKASNLVGIVDVNRLGQSGETMLGWDTDAYKVRIEAFGWDALVVDGHNFEQISNVLEKVGKSKKPLMILAKTIKGKGVSFLEDKEGWHGKVLGEDEFKKAVGELGEVDRLIRGKVGEPEGKFQISNGSRFQQKSKFPISNKKLKIPYNVGEEIATRKVFGEALVAVGEDNDKVVSLDAEVKNSTYSELFGAKFPKRFYEMFIAEQNMVSVAVGLSCRGYIPFVSTFGVFLARAFDQIRMAALSRANIKFVGSHAGVSVGEDGPSQMALADIAMFRSIEKSIIFYPADGIATWCLVELAVANEGIFYVRANRPKTPIIYEKDEDFRIGGSKVLRSSKKDKLVVVACGITLIEAIKAADELAKENISIRVLDAYSVKPIDEAGIRHAAFEANNIIMTVEDHYPEGGLGDAVLNVFSGGGVQVHKLAVYKTPKSGTTQELLDYEEISAKAIVAKVKELI